MHHHLSPLLCSAPDGEALRAFGHPIAVQVDPDPQKPLPREIVWCPAGEHEIYAHNSEMQPVQARVVCDETAARAIAAHFEALRAQGSRVWLDKNHESAEATADIRAFAWDPARGIVATVDWTPYGERLLRDRVFCSFSPEFLRNKSTGRPNMLIVGRASGGLVNAPAFGAAMPALIAARLAGAEVNATTAPAGSAGESDPAMNKEQLTKLLAALGVTLAPDADASATEAAINQAIAKASGPVAASSAGTPPTAELETLRAQLSSVRKEKAKTAVDAAVVRGALPAKDEALQAKWAGLIEADPAHEQLLAALPGNPALQRVTTPGAGIVQVRDGAVDVLRALAATPAADSAKRAEIYGRSIAPLFKEPGFQLGPILAANALGTLTGDLVAQRALSLLKLSFPVLSSISTGFSAENLAFGQSVKTRLRAVPSVVDYVAGTGYATSDATTTDVSVVINAHKAVQIGFNANELASTNRDLFGEQVEGAQYALGKALVDALYALITAGNFANATTKALATFARTDVTAMAKALYNRGVPEMGRTLLLNPDYFEKLGQDSTIVSLAAYQRPEVITDWKLPPVAKFDIQQAVNLPTTGNLTGFGFTTDALALATRVPNDYTKALPGASHGSVSVVTNPDTGISVQLVQYVDHKLGAASWRIALMFGVAVGQAASGQRLISA